MDFVLDAAVPFVENNIEYEFKVACYQNYFELITFDSYKVLYKSIRRGGTNS